MKTKLICLFTLLVTSTLAHANQAMFVEISEEASVANGSADVTTYDTTLSKEALQAQGKAELEKEYWEDCGPWQEVKSFRTVIKNVRELEDLVNETSVADKLQKLNRKKEIFTVVGAISSNRIECSLYWFNIYGTDGSKLELRYNVGD